MTTLRQPYATLSAPALQHLRAIKQQLEDSPLGRNLVSWFTCAFHSSTAVPFVWICMVVPCAAAAIAPRGWIRWRAGG